VLYVVRWRALRWADHLSNGVLPSVVWCCLWSINLQNEEAIAHIGPQHHGVWGKTQCRFWSHHVGFAAHNVVFIDTVTSQPGELTNKTMFSIYFQTLMVYLNPSNGIL
jgi:hypothetical protein